MYQAKERGRGSGRTQLFDADVRDRAVTRYTVESELRRGIECGELRVHYQPLHVLDTGALSGVEALVRWQHPTRGLLFPAEFIAVAEESNLIVALGAWVLDEALRQLAQWNAGRPRGSDITMAVNVSARQIGSLRFVDTVAETVAKHGIAPRLVCLEITETALIEEAVSAPEVFEALHRLGVLIALDDFGTGYSSLAHLRRFPVDIIKIDRQFVGGPYHSPSDTAVATAITAMAHALGMTTVAEGVETAAQLAELLAMGCDDAQGFLLAKPMSGEDMSAVLDEG